MTLPHACRGAGGGGQDTVGPSPGAGSGLLGRRRSWQAPFLQPCERGLWQPRGRWQYPTVCGGGKIFWKEQLLTHVEVGPARAVLSASRCCL